MPRASHRLDLIIVPSDIRRVPDQTAFDHLCRRWQTCGELNENGEGPGLDSLISGGFRRVWLDLPGRVVLYTNQQGGYRVNCPECNINLAAEFSLSVQQWRSGAPRRMTCVGCKVDSPLERLLLSPPGAFAQGGIVFTDVGSLQTSSKLQVDAQSVVGPGTFIYRRVS